MILIYKRLKKLKKGESIMYEVSTISIEAVNMYPGKTDDNNKPYMKEVLQIQLENKEDNKLEIQLDREDLEKLKWNIKNILDGGM